MTTNSQPTQDELLANLREQLAYDKRHRSNPINFAITNLTLDSRIARLGLEIETLEKNWRPPALGSHQTETETETTE